MNNFLKNKKGSSVIILVFLIPTIILIVFGIAYKNMISSTAEKGITTNINNILYYGSKKYGNIRSDNENKEFCVFLPSDIFGSSATETTIFTEKSVISDPNCFVYEFRNYIEKTDGYNNLWQYEISLVKNKDQIYDLDKNENNTYIQIKMKIVLPKRYNVASFGTYNARTGTSTGWYAENKVVWEEMVRLYEQEQNDQSLIIINNLISIGSCV